MRKTTVTTSGGTTDEYLQIFSYGDMERLLVALMVQNLIDDGEIEPPAKGVKQDTWLRVESRRCEPDGDMGWPGIAVTLMVGPADYYPRSMENSYSKGFYQRSTTTVLTPDGLKEQRPKAWRRLLSLVRGMCARTKRRGW